MIEIDEALNHVGYQILEHHIRQLDFDFDFLVFVCVPLVVALVHLLTSDYFVSQQSHKSVFFDLIEGVVVDLSWHLDK